MRRRDFLACMAIISTIPNITLAKENKDEWIVIETVYDTLFPQTSTMPSAKTFGALEYLQKNIEHKTFDKDEKEFILQGARDFIRAFPNFLHVKQKEPILEELKENSYGNSWLDMLIYYGIEAMMSDPIYGGNKNKSGWKSVKHEGGIPAPKRRFIRGYDAV